MNHLVFMCLRGEFLPNSLDVLLLSLDTKRFCVLMMFCVSVEFFGTGQEFFLDWTRVFLWDRTGVFWDWTGVFWDWTGDFWD